MFVAENGRCEVGPKIGGRWALKNGGDWPHKQVGDER